MSRYIFRLLQSLGLASAMLAGAATATAAAAPVSSPSTAPVNAHVLARAKEWLLALQAGSVDRAQLTHRMNALLSNAYVDHFEDTVGPFGPPTSLVQSRIVHSSGSTAYVYHVTFKNGTRALMIFDLDDATSKISGLRFTLAP